MRKSVEVWPRFRFFLALNIENLVLKKEIGLGFKAAG
jgi:hypothetical protein